MNRMTLAGFAAMGACLSGVAAPDPETLEALRRIVAPRVVAVPPENACLRPDAWAELQIRWDEKAAQFRVGEDAWNDLPRLFPTRNGISYLHIQSAAGGADPGGVLIESVKAVSTAP